MRVAGEYKVDPRFIFPNVHNNEMEERKTKPIATISLDFVAMPLLCFIYPLLQMPSYRWVTCKISISHSFVA